MYAACAVLYLLEFSSSMLWLVDTGFGKNGVFYWKLGMSGRRRPRIRPSLLFWVLVRHLYVGPVYHTWVRSFWSDRWKFSISRIIIQLNPVYPSVLLYSVEYRTFSTLLSEWTMSTRNEQLSPDLLRFPSNRSYLKVRCIYRKLSWRIGNFRVTTESRGSN